MEKGSIFYHNARLEALKRACQIDEAELWIKEKRKLPEYIPLKAPKLTITALYALCKGMLP